MIENEFLVCYAIVATGRSAQMLHFVFQPLGSWQALMSQRSGSILVFLSPHTCKRLSSPLSHTAATSPVGLGIISYSLAVAVLLAPTAVVVDGDRHAGSVDILILCSPCFLVVHFLFVFMLLLFLPCSPSTSLCPF